MGVGLEHILLLMLKPVLPAALPAASGWPWLWAIGAMVVISLLVGLRPYRLLLATLPLRVLRQDVVANVCTADDLYSSGVRGGGSPAGAADGRQPPAMGGAGGRRGAGAAVRPGGMGRSVATEAFDVKSAAAAPGTVNRLLRQPWSTLSQLAAFSLSFMLLALLLVLRGDLLDRWQQQLPPESPNYFLINIAPEQVVPVKTFLAEHQTRATEFYPIVRARLTQINGQVTEGNKDEALNRELNLTWSRERPDHNPLVAGSWPPKAGEVSIEEGLAQRLGVKLGDSVAFTGDTQDFSAKVSSVRKVDWESLRYELLLYLPAGGRSTVPAAKLADQLPLG